MQRRKDYEVIGLRPGANIPVFVTYVTDPDAFFIQLSPPEPGQTSIDDISELINVCFKICYLCCMLLTIIYLCTILTLH